jgi:hypothetical protein
MSAQPRWPLAIAGAGLLSLLAFGCAVPSIPSHVRPGGSARGEQR